jgi:ABC-type nitrate/sulfonate/bicarbonate transport system substrate-binding protein
MDASDHRARIDRRMFAAAAAAWTGAAAGWLQGTPGSAAPPNSPAKPGPRALWPQHTDSAPYIHAADFGLKPCLPVTR